jgi:hypothetical protein
VVAVAVGVGVFFFVDGFGVAVGVAGTGVGVAGAVVGVAVGGAAVGLGVGGAGGGVIGVGITDGGGGGVLAAAKVRGTDVCARPPTANMPADRGNARARDRDLFMQRSLRED